MPIVENLKDVKPAPLPPLSRVDFERVQGERYLYLIGRLFAAETALVDMEAKLEKMEATIGRLTRQLRRVDHRSALNRGRILAMVMNAPALEHVQAQTVATVAQTFRGIESFDQHIAAEKIAKQVRKLLAQGRKLSAVKLWQDHYSCDLRTALDRVNAFQDADAIAA